MSGSFTHQSDFIILTTKDFKICPIVQITLTCLHATFHC